MTNAVYVNSILFIRAAPIPTIRAAINLNSASVHSTRFANEHVNIIKQILSYFEVPIHLFN